SSTCPARPQARSELAARAPVVQPPIFCSKVVSRSFQQVVLPSALGSRLNSQRVALIGQRLAAVKLPEIYLAVLATALPIRSRAVAAPVRILVGQELRIWAALALRILAGRAHRARTFRRTARSESKTVASGSKTGSSAATKFAISITRTTRAISGSNIRA